MLPDGRSRKRLIDFYAVASFSEAAAILIFTTVKFLQILQESRSKWEKVTDREDSVRK